MKKKNLLAIGLQLVCVFFLTNCGGSKSDNTTDSSTPNTPAAPQAETCPAGELAGAAAG